MNKVFKVIWSEARNAYVVVSEIAKNHGSKSCSTKKLLTMLIATGVMTCASMAPAMADNPAPNDLNVTIGKGAHVSVWNGVTGQNINGDIAIGPNAHAWNGEHSYGSEGRIGSKEYLLDFGQGGVVGAENIFGYFYKYKVADGSKIAGSIAIGKNTIARTGSVMLGDHSYTGKLGDIEINPEKAMTYNDGIYSTTLGAGAYNSGSLAAVTGALSIASGSDTKNTGATIYGSMNSIESATSDNIYSGVASSVLGFANRTQNANAALIWGTGNEVTNSIEKVGIDTNWNNVSVAEAQKKAIEAMQSSKYAGGSVMAIGGGNKADYAKYSQLTGVQNKVTGTKDKAAKYDFVNGYKNTVTEASDVTVIGIKNEVTADGNKVIGDNHNVSGKDNVIFGSADEVTETTVNNAVVLGHNAKVTGEGGVALGAGSVADRANAVSVGSKGAERQIINVKAGVQDTDAVNVSQLKDVKAEAGKHTTLSDGKNTKVEPTVTAGQTDYKVNVAGDLTDITSVADGGAKLALNGAAGTAGIINGQGASVVMMNGSTTINGVVGIDNTGKISGVANGEADKDAVNYGQLKDVKAEALKHSTVTNGDNIAVTETTNKDGGKEYKVALNNDIHLFGDNDAMVSISGSHGTIWATGGVTAGSVAAGDVFMDGATATVSGLSNTTTAYAGFATTGKAATEEQLKEVATEAGKHTQVKAGTNVGIVEDGTHVYTVNADGTTVSGDSNVVVTAGKKDANNVTNYGVKLNKDLAGIESISNGNAKLALNGEAGYAGIVNGKGASVFMQGSTTVINGVVGIDQNGKISGVAAGVADKDAVNVSQLNKVSVEAGKHTTLVAGDNVQVKEEKTDNGLKYTVSATDTTYTAGNGIAINGENNAISVKLNKDEKNLEVTADGLSLNKDLKGIESISNNTSKLVLREGWAGMQNGVGASVFMVGGLTTINDKVTVDEQGKISGVAAGKISADSTDAVNGSQLNAVATEAGKHSKVVNGNNTNVEETTVDGQKVYKVNLNNNIMVGDVTGKYVSISGTNGTIEATGAIATKDRVYADKGGKLADIDVTGNTISNGDAKLALNGAAGTAGIVNGKGASVYMQDGYTVINSKVSFDQDGKISGVAAGKISADSTDAVNGSQLNAVATEAGKHSKVVNGNNTNVEETTVDGQKVYKVNLNNNIMVGDVTGKYVSISGTNGTIETTGYIATNDRVYADKGGKLADIDVTGNTISNGDAKLALNGAAGTAGIVNGKGASVYMQDGYTVINSKVSFDQNGKISGVADGVNNDDAVNVSQLKKVSETANAGWNLSTNGVAPEATNVKPGDFVDFSGDKNISVSHDGSKVKVELNKNIDVNYVQTNALNAKYNLSVGTANENGTVPFFVNSNGSFYAANGKLVVDKDGKLVAPEAELGKVTADEGEIGNVVLKDGVFYKNTALRDGELYVGDADGNYSQITPKSAKLGQVTIDEKGNIAGVNSLQTNALNAKYNLSVGTANENGTVPFFVNSNGAFYAANGKLVVDKDGKVTATAGEIGNVVLNNGVYTGHSALRDGELFVGDASGNYSQITTKGAKLGQVTIAADGKISGVAAGEVSSTSTDAINGSQLHQTNVDVAQNKADIAQNKADIAANRADIDKNKADIAANRADIDKNKADIAANRADIDKNKADIAANRADIDKNTADISKLDTRVTNVEELAKKHTTVTAGDNITVSEDTNKDGGKEYKVALDKDIKLDSVTAGQTVMNNDGLKVGKDVSVTATAVTAGQTSISNDGVKVGDKTYISDKGLNANDQNVTNVKAGELSETSKDAVNGSQLYKTNQEVANNTNRINQLGNRVNKVGAGAAALAALHPMDFDPDDKLTFSAGYGNYGGENAAAIGAYYRPDEKVMFSVGGTVGNGENMVNAGVSFSLDRTNHVSNSRTAMAREILDLRAEVTELKAMVAKGGLGSIAEDKMKIFPDVAENHWAYEYVGKLAAAGIIEGYPDGNFSGDRMMSRYEFAAMLYRAMQKGAQLDSKIINEFAPEMGRIRVDRISGEDGDRDKIERVRVNAVKGERDHYGNKIAKAEAKAK